MPDILEFLEDGQELSVAESVQIPEERGLIEEGEKQQYGFAKEVIFARMLLLFIRFLLTC